jgi:hypothetical protein
MSGGTHVFDMIKRLKENDNLRKLKYFKRKKEIYHAVEKNLGITYKSANPAEKELLRTELIKRRSREYKSAIRIFLIIAAIAIMIVIAVLKLQLP